MNATSRSLVLAVLLAAGGYAPTGLAATFDAGVPLLQVEARGREADTLLLPFCGVACVGLHPTYVTHQITVGLDGMVTAVRTWNRLEDSDGTSSEVVAGLGQSVTFRALRQALATARIGLAEGGCRLMHIPAHSGHRFRREAGHPSGATRSAFRREAGQ